MSTYYQCRLNKLKLDLSERRDILIWINSCKEIRDEIIQDIYKDDDPKTPYEIPNTSRCDQLFYNSFEGVNSYDNELYLNTNNIDSVIIDYVLGNKNKDNDIIQAIMLLGKYWVSGNIILWDESNYRIFNMEKIKNSDIDPVNIDSDFDYGEYYDFNYDEGSKLFNEDILDCDETIDELVVSKYDKLLNKVKKNTGIETISLTIDSNNIIVDDYSIPKCLVHATVMYDAMHIASGDNLKVGITDQDMVDFNILPPLNNNYATGYNLDNIKPSKILENDTSWHKTVAEEHTNDYINYNLIAANAEVQLNKWIKENSESSDFTDKVQKLWFSVDGKYYIAICSIKQLNNVDSNIPIYKDGNRLGKKKQEVIQNRLKSIQDGSAKYLSDEDLKVIINKRKDK